MRNLILWETDVRSDFLDLVIDKVGVERIEPVDAIDRPRGIDQYLFLHFLRPVRIRGVDGITQERAGCCFLYSPGFPQWYSSRPEDLVHNWFHFSGRRAERLVQRYRIPCNRPFYPSHMDFSTEVIYEMYRERLLKRSGYERALEVIAEYFFLRLSRVLYDEPADRLTPRKRALYYRLQEVREQVHQRIDYHWTVPEMAKAAGLSSSRFSVLFKEFFGVSPMEDLLVTRLKAACMQLASSSRRVQDIARLCGFRSVEYFTRAFRQRVGCSPREYSRRTNPALRLSGRGARSERS
ncbi:MAG: hypothetical protein KatS3mg115_2243 [Candidatus Poribacteria bacterium]|nr:MAG: hypothetical protein KatS3mg115_2243 [Candidatus Poribacteria bacterium]